MTASRETTLPMSSGEYLRWGREAWHASGRCNEARRDVPWVVSIARNPWRVERAGSEVRTALRRGWQTAVRTRSSQPRIVLGKLEFRGIDDSFQGDDGARWLPGRARGR